MTPSVLAIAAHPDDIELTMAGTLLQLAGRGWQVHYFNIANGCCGSKTLSRPLCAAVRLEEARSAAALFPATFHPPICNDLEIFYNTELLARVASVVRLAKPTIILTHAPVDYMEDHQNAARLAVGAAFIRAMPNCITDPAEAVFEHDVALYHAQPHGNRDPLGQTVQPTHFVDVENLLDKKRQLLAAHQSQDEWLDATQRISAYLETMVELNREVGQMSQSVARAQNRRPYAYAEGWRQHLHIGLSESNFDPLYQSLGDCLLKNC
jgi:LmbE family N-acetylglucosaminyl deacetylase